MTPDTATFGNDLIAGGADDDMIFGQLGNDILHGDGQITDPGLTATTLEL
jgi:Ca2+-binding RTX toxin-like protein